jgi:hypothetical protein
VATTPGFASRRANPPKAPGAANPAATPRPRHPRRVGPAAVDDS